MYEYLISIVLLISGVAADDAFKPLKNTIKDAAGALFDLVPDANWTLTQINHTIVMAEETLALNTPFNVYFALYTSQNSKNPQHLYDGDEDSVRKSNFNSTNPTRFVCHGWNSNNQSDINTMIRDGYLGLGDFNVIVVDWSEAANTINYVKSAVSTRPASKKLASFIMFLVHTANLDPNNTYLIGHSLGAHVVGMAGRQVNPMINTIFGLDAAKPLFTFHLQHRRIAKTDAMYVETIHTDGGLLGFERPIGNASFYPHFGFSQPGCYDITTACDHSRSYMYFAETLNDTNQFLAKKCKRFRDLLKRMCDGTGMNALMGGEPSNFGKGIRGAHYLPVNNGFPFGKGTVF